MNIVTPLLSAALALIPMVSRKAPIFPAVTPNAYSTDASTYYDSIGDATGKELLGKLHDLLVTTHKTYSTYEDCKTPSIVLETDGDDSGDVVEFYSGVSLASSWGSGKQGTWNREHVWCQSRSSGLWGESYGGSDLHHIRPAEAGLNSARNNSPYGIVTAHDSQTARYAEDANNEPLGIGGYKSGDVFEPLDGKKGDVARILLYVYTHYSTYTAIGGSTDGTANKRTGDLSITSIVDASSEEEAFDLLLDWNELDPVDEGERKRNEAVASFQGNRNPYIDNPSYASLIFEGVSLSFESSALSMTVGEERSFPASVSGDEGEISYSSDDENVASIDETGLVKAVSAGQTTLRAEATVNGTPLSASCVLTVTTPAEDLGRFVLLDDPADYQDGDYLIAAESTSSGASVSGTVFFDGSLEKPDAANNYHAETLSYDGEDIVATESLLGAAVTLSGDKDSFSIKTRSGLYISSSSGDDNNLTVSSSDPGSASNNALSLSGSEVLLKGLKGGVLRFNKASNQLRFRFYKDETYGQQSSVRLYRYEEKEAMKSALADARAYADRFLAELTCDATGATPPDKNVWASLKTGYEALSEEAKKAFQTSDDATILSARERYDYIVGKYGSDEYPDFLNRNPARIAMKNRAFGQEASWLALIALGGALAISVSIILIIVVKRRKTDEKS